MEDPIKETIEDFGDKIEGEVNSPYQHHLSYVQIFQTIRREQKRKFSQRDIENFTHSEMGTS